MEEQQGKEKGLKNWEVALMIATALFFDALNALLNLIFMGWVVSIFAFLTFYVWFKIKGIHFMTPKRFTAMWGGFIFELIPALSVLPGWTVAVAFLALEKKVVEKLPAGARTLLPMAEEKK